MRNTQIKLEENPTSVWSRPRDKQIFRLGKCWIVELIKALLRFVKELLILPEMVNAVIDDGEDGMNENGTKVEGKWKNHKGTYLQLAIFPLQLPLEGSLF
ncbi:Protein of unknown function [Gryllus bimaculatus]|nr:Protein of unknown function [Gryllus bimaculatus]